MLPSPAAPNVSRPAALQEALTALNMASPGKPLGAALVLPDYAVRMSVLDFEQFPSEASEQAALVKFRFRKSLPFPVEDAQISYSVQLVEEKNTEVLAVAIAKPILLEYETLLTDAGFRVGMVAPTSVALLPLCNRSEQSGSSLLAKASSNSLTLLLFDRKHIRLVRCLTMSGSESQDENVLMPLLQQTLAYAEDELGRPVEQLLFSGFGRVTEQLGMAAQQEFDLPYAIPRSKFGPGAQEHPGLYGLLEQYA